MAPRSSQDADAARIAVDELVGDRFRRGGGPVGVALTGDLYPPFPPDDVRSPPRQAVTLGAAVAAAGLAGRVRPVEPLTALATPRGELRRPWVVERLPDEPPPEPSRRSWSRRLLDRVRSFSAARGRR